MRAQAAFGAQAEAVDPGRPLVLAAEGRGGPRIAALNRAAALAGLAVGEPVANAHSKVLGLQVRPADPAADAEALRRLALWCMRYTPFVAAWGEENGADGLFLDIAGCARLFGGEAALLDDLAQRLRGFGLQARLAAADAPGTAWAMARFGRSRAMVPTGGEADALRGLPPAALRLGEETLASLRRLGFRRIGDLECQPRAPLAARLGPLLLLRLDQAMARAAEPLSPLAPPPRYRSRLDFPDAIATEAHMVEAATRLLAALTGDLERDGAGIRRAVLHLFRPDGGVLSLDVGLAAPSRNVAHIARLIGLRLERQPRGPETGFGFEAATLHVVEAERMTAHQALLPGTAGSGEPAGLAGLLDRLQHRMGPRSARRLAPLPSHVPERAQRLRPALADQTPAWPDEGRSRARPLLLLAQPEPLQGFLAEAPDGVPHRFQWDGTVHHVAHAEGPERVAPEWWRREGGGERDYYVVEDTRGRRFWLYREGAAGRGAAHAAWFMHGVFP